MYNAQNVISGLMKEQTPIIILLINDVSNIKVGVYLGLDQGNDENFKLKAYVEKQNKIISYADFNTTFRNINGYTG